MNWKPYISASSWDREPKFSRKLLYILEQFFWKCGLSISHTSWDISVLTKEFTLKCMIVFIHYLKIFLNWKPYTSGSTWDKEPKHSGKVLYISDQLAWKIGLSIFSGSGDIRLSIQKFDQTMMKHLFVYIAF